MDVCLSSVHQHLLQATSPPKPLNEISPNFTGMMIDLGMVLRVVQRIQFHHAELWLTLQPKGKTLKIISQFYSVSERN